MEERQDQNRAKMAKYKYEKVVGSGAYGEVYKGRNEDTGETVAIKKTTIDDLINGIPSNMLREISILKELEHENIVSLKDIVFSGNAVFFVQEFCEIDLEKFLKDK